MGLWGFFFLSHLAKFQGRPLFFGGRGCLFFLGGGGRVAFFFGGGGGVGLPFFFFWGGVGWDIWGTSFAQLPHFHPRGWEKGGRIRGEEWPQWPQARPVGSRVGSYKGSQERKFEVDLGMGQN